MRDRLAILMLLSLISGTAGADGGYYFIEGLIAEAAQSADQQAIIIYENGQESMILRTGYEGESQNYAWVIPVPALVGPDNVSTAHHDAFNILDRATAPIFFKESYCGECGSMETDVYEYRGVTVWEEFRVDDYKINTLSVDDSENLGRWLTDNGYSLPEGSEDVLSFYIEKGWKFVAMQVENPGSSSQSMRPNQSSTSAELRPIQITFPSDTIVYPLRISSVSTKEEVEILIFVITDFRVDPQNYPVEAVNIQIEQAAGRYDWSIYYEARFMREIEAMKPRGFVVEYSGRLDSTMSEYYQYDYYHQYADGNMSAEDIIDSLWSWGWSDMDNYYITRLRTRFRPSDMNDDVCFIQSASNNPVSTRIEIAGAVPFLDGGGNQRSYVVMTVGLGFMFSAVMGVIRRSSRFFYRSTFIFFVIWILLL